MVEFEFPLAEVEEGEIRFYIPLIIFIARQEIKWERGKISDLKTAGTQDFPETMFIDQGMGKKIKGVQMFFIYPAKTAVKFSQFYLKTLGQIINHITFTDFWFFLTREKS